MKRDRIIVFGLVAIMVLSAAITSLAFLAQDNEATTNTANQQPTEEEINEIINQQIAMNDQIPQDRFLPEGDVRELQIQDLSTGQGQAVTAEDTITVHYTGWLASDGTVFDSSHLRGEPATFPLNGVIAGWQAGIPGMKPGGQRRLIVPAELAYGASGSGSSIPPNADLVFEVELVSIE